MKEANREVLDAGSLPHLLVHRARHTSDRRLAIDAASGITVAAAVTILRPPFWVPLAALALCLGMYGIWGILDRELGDVDQVTSRTRLLAFARGFVGILGVAVAVIFGITVLFGMLGPLIS